MHYKVTLKFDIIYGRGGVTVQWPTTLPTKLLHEGFSLSPVSNTIRTKVDAGPVNQRPRYSVEVEEVSGSILFTNAQLTTFWTFYHTTLGSGALCFNWKHPITGTDCVCQMNGEEPPTVQSV